MGCSVNRESDLAGKELLLKGQGRRLVTTGRRDFNGEVDDLARQGSWIVNCFADNQLV